MEEKEKTIYKKKNILLSIPFEIDRRYRDEAKKREINISDLLERLIEERDYFERKLVEKDRLIENGTEIIHKSIVESLSEIKNTNLQLKVVSSSLSSIPQVTEEARKINEHSTKSAEVIKNFNVVLKNLNEEIVLTRETVKTYNEKVKSNFDSLNIINKEFTSLKSNTNQFLNDVANIFKLKTEEIINNFKLETNKFISSEKEKVIKLGRLFDGKIMIIISVLLIFTSITSIAFLYNYFSDISELKSDDLYYRDQVQKFQNLMCEYRPPVPGYNYKKACK